MNIFSLTKFADKRIACILIADGLVLNSVIFWDLNPGRMYAFYYLEFATFLISYGVYNRITNKKLGLSSITIATAGMLFLMGSFILIAIKGVLYTSIENGQDILELFYPYFDVPIFLISIISAHVFNVKKYLTFDNNESKGSFSMLLMYNFLLIPFLIGFSFVATKFNFNLEINLVISLIIIRNFIEYMRYKGLQQLKLQEAS